VFVHYLIYRQELGFEVAKDVYVSEKLGKLTNNLCIIVIVGIQVHFMSLKSCGAGEINN
jgi:hypothetical protein